MDDIKVTFIGALMIPMIYNYRMVYMSIIQHKWSLYGVYMMFN